MLQFAHDHHAFHEDAKPGDLTGQFGTRRFSSSKKLMTVGVAVPFLLRAPLVVVMVVAKVWGSFRSRRRRRRPFGRPPRRRDR